MNIVSLITLFPEMFDALKSSIPGRAQANGLIELQYFNPRDFTTDTHRTVDDRPYGGGPGMVMMAEPLIKAIEAAKASKDMPAQVIYLSPQGTPLAQTKVNTLSTTEHLILLCGRYEGIDERVIALAVDEELSVGDYVLSGGELPAMILIDAMTRQIPGALGDEQSAAQDSFSGGLLDCPHYTRPECFQGVSVPGVLLSGHHEAIKQWRLGQSLLRTKARRPDLFSKKELTSTEELLLNTAHEN